MQFKKITSLFAVGLICSWCGLAGGAQTSNASQPPALYLGTAWYPEQWPESRWDADLELMQQAGIRFVRVDEFAWSRLEPTEGQYDLDWLYRAVRAAERHHIAIVIGTPSATPPAWLTSHYPQTLRILPDGRRDQHGNRQQFNFDDPKYRELVRDIDTRLGQRFGHDPDVIGWQIGNEYANESYGPETQALFDAWLKKKYVTLENLNRRWTTAYWSQTYTDWNQIPIEETYGNPGLLLNWKLFVTDTWRSYQKNQIDALRPYLKPDQFITTNYMGFFDAFDLHTVAQDLTLASWDDYVGTGHLDPIYNGAAHDLTRGFLRKNFWVMETQPGFVNWAPVNNALDKGEVRAMAWHDIAHGADAVSYWQWRSALNGQEEYHGTLVGADGTPVPLYPEVARIGREFAKAGPALAGTSVHSEVAILMSYESRWAVNWQRHNHDFDPVQAMLSYYGPLRTMVHSVDIVSPTVPLGSYKLVVAPALNVITPEIARNLIAYVKGGGHLVLGQRTGMKDEDNALQTARQPGPLEELLGGRVEQYYALLQPVPVSGEWGSGDDKLWAEQLSTNSPDTQVLLRYGKSNGWLDGQPAAITRKVGSGSITYIGCWPDDAQMNQAAHWMLKQAGVPAFLDTLAKGVEVSVRSGDGKEIWIVENLSEGPQQIALPGEFTDVLNGGDVSSLQMARFDVAVLQKKP